MIGRVVGPFLLSLRWMVMGLSPQLGYEHWAQVPNAAPGRYSKNWYDIKFV